MTCAAVVDHDEGHVKCRCVGPGKRQKHSSMCAITRPRKRASSSEDFARAAGYPSENCRWLGS
eukprot:scaffold886_cov249-Pinguiococcus_pyrenoidosus.AAC.4